MSADKKLEIPVLPDHESGVRRMIADAAGRPYRAFRTLAEARADPDGIVVFEGDYGGQIYAVCPAGAVRCSEDDLRVLLRDLDSFEWDDAGGARVFFEALPMGSIVPGGMGGGRVEEGLWVHPRLAQHATAIQAVVDGRRSRIR
jgi:hypothetical protein